MFLFCFFWILREFFGQGFKRVSVVFSIFKTLLILLALFRLPRVINKWIRTVKVSLDQNKHVLWSNKAEGRKPLRHFPESGILVSADQLWGTDSLNVLESFTKDKVIFLSYFFMLSSNWQLGASLLCGLSLHQLLFFLRFPLSKHCLINKTILLTIIKKRKSKILLCS